MNKSLEVIQDTLRTLKLDDSLLALNHFLGVSNGLTTNPNLELKINRLKFRPPAYIVHFLAKQLLLHASNLGTRTLGWDQFLQLIDLCLSLDDPIVYDPDWKSADPTGFFERIMAQQLPAQAIKPIQRYGLALGLFRDVGAVEWPHHYDLRSELEAEIGLTVEQFMAMGFACQSFQAASYHGHKCPGTFTPMFMAEAYRQGISVCIPEVWTRFLPRVACQRDEFRQVNDRGIYRVTKPHFLQFEFNPLHRFPIIEVKPGHFIAVDPYLVVERTTLGLFYDLFERDSVTFTVRFGHAFDRFIGQLLSSVCRPGSLWSASRWEQHQPKSKRAEHGKIGDWAYAGRNCTVLFECKSIRPSLELTTYGTDDSVQRVADRIASALEQLTGFNRAIQQGSWIGEGLLPSPVVFAIVTYGRISTVNGPFTRRRIRQQLEQKGIITPPFVVLSLEEVDQVVRLVELGKSLDEVILALTAQVDSFNVMRLFQEDLKQVAISSFTYNKGNEFLSTVLN